MDEQRAAVWQKFKASIILYLDDRNPDMPECLAHGSCTHANELSVGSQGLFGQVITVVDAPSCHIPMLKRLKFWDWMCKRIRLMKPAGDCTVGQYGRTCHVVDRANIQKQTAWSYWYYRSSTWKIKEEAALPRPLNKADESWSWNLPRRAQSKMTAAEQLL